jgi:hypothetical protein
MSSTTSPRWRIAGAIALVTMLCGGGVALWAAYHAPRSVLLWNIATLLLVFGFALGLACWVASKRRLQPCDRRRI